MRTTYQTAQLRMPDELKPESVGRRLRAIRVAHNLKAKELADRLEINPIYWSRWERGLRPIPTDIAWKLTQLFGVDLDYIMAGETRSLSLEVRDLLAAASSHTETED